LGVSSCEPKGLQNSNRYAISRLAVKQIDKGPSNYFMQKESFLGKEDDG
jgi:hypothetical protein